MRMFLVCMCDIFLILYLTTLGQVDRNTVSDLTVSDYLELKAKEEELRAQGMRYEEAMAAMSKAVEEREQRLKEVESSAQTITTERENLRKHIEKVKQKSAEELELLRNKFNATSKEALAAKELLSKGEQALKALEHKAQSLKTEVALATKAIQEKERLAALALEREERAKTAAKQAAEKASEAEAAKLAAEQTATNAELRAARALQSERSAIRRASEAHSVATESALKALRAKERANVAVEQSVKAKKTLEAVKQPASQAYHQTVRSRIRAITVKSHYENLLIGSSKDEISLRGVPVGIGREEILFLPLIQLGLKSKSDRDRFRSFEILMGLQQVTKLYLSPSAPHLVGLVVGRAPIRRNTPIGSLPLPKVMPTLFALRSGGRMVFSDRFKDISDDYFIFRRDNLKKQSSSFYRYEAVGRRGSGDYAERLVRGDQIVDLNGNVFGVAVLENLVMPVTSLNGWKQLALDPKRPQAFFQSLWSNVKELD